MLLKTLKNQIVWTICAERVVCLYLVIGKQILFSYNHEEDAFKNIACIPPNLCPPSLIPFMQAVHKTDQQQQIHL